MPDDISRDPNYIYGLGGDYDRDNFFRFRNQRPYQGVVPNIDRGGAGGQPVVGDPDKWFHLPGEKIVTETEETRVPNASNFHFIKEDHTLGNLLRDRLFRMPHVLFSGYKVAHPSINEFDLRVQTDGTFTPKEALVRAVRSLITDFGIMAREFTKEWELHRVRMEGQRLSNEQAAETSAAEASAAEVSAAEVNAVAAGTGEANVGTDGAADGAADGTADGTGDGTGDGPADI